MWTCPRCGHSFVIANLWHSCGVFAMSEHFDSHDPRVAETFEAIVDAAKTCGPLAVYAQKSRIVLQNRVRFASRHGRPRWLAKPDERCTTFAGLIEMDDTSGVIRSVITRKKHLILGLWLTHRIEHPLFTRYELDGNGIHYPYFQIGEATQLDAALRGWIAEAYVHGARR